MIESFVLSNLVYNSEYLEKVIPFIKEEYFQREEEKVLFRIINDYTIKYKEAPTKEAICLEITTKELPQQVFENTVKLVEDLSIEEKNINYLITKTEEFCQERAIHNALLKAIKISDGKDSTLGKASIPVILSEALAVSFDNNIGHDFIEDAESRYESYVRKEEKIPFDIDNLNKVTSGGLPNKTLNVFLASCVHPDTKVKVRIKPKHISN